MSAHQGESSFTVPMVKGMSPGIEWIYASLQCQL